jgi:hypothetical protein
MTAMPSAGKSRAWSRAQHPTQGQPPLEKLLLARLYRNRNAIERHNFLAAV